MEALLTDLAGAIRRFTRVGSGGSYGDDTVRAALPAAGLTLFLLAAEEDVRLDDRDERRDALANPAAAPLEERSSCCARACATRPSTSSMTRLVGAAPASRFGSRQQEVQRRERPSRAGEQLDAVDHGHDGREDRTDELATPRRGRGGRVRRRWVERRRRASTRRWGDDVSTHPSRARARASARRARGGGGARAASVTTRRHQRRQRLLGPNDRARENMARI